MARKMLMMELFTCVARSAWPAGHSPCLSCSSCVCVLAPCGFVVCLPAPGNGMPLPAAICGVAYRAAAAAAAAAVPTNLESPSCLLSSCPAPRKEYPILFI